MFKTLIRKLFFVLILLLPCFTFAGQGSEQIAAYFQLWLDDHKVKSSIDENHILSITGTELKVDGEILQVSKKGEGVFMVETQFRMQLPNKKMIVENVVGMGATAEDAFMDSMLNLCSTTFHPIYVEFIDLKDTHVNRQEVEFSGEKRIVFFADWGLRGDQVPAIALESLLSEVFTAMQSLKFDKETHWGKLTALLVNGKIEFLEFDLDNELHEEMSKELMKVNWPMSEKFYILKLFFVVGHAQ